MHVVNQGENVKDRMEENQGDDVALIGNRNVCNVGVIKVVVSRYVNAQSAHGATQSEKSTHEADQLANTCGDSIGNLPMSSTDQSCENCIVTELNVQDMGRSLHGPIIPKLSEAELQPIQRTNQQVLELDAETARYATFVQAQCEAPKWVGPCLHNAVNVNKDTRQICDDKTQCEERAVQQDIGVSDSEIQVGQQGDCVQEGSEFQKNTQIMGLPDVGS
ncbi:ABC transporter ATP-binding protein [Sesbania bispinosa]|nr:ABC transporter ATP-binding protein [Sesbania bispinosa]